MICNKMIYCIFGYWVQNRQTTKHFSYDHWAIFKSYVHFSLRCASSFDRKSYVGNGPFLA